MVTADGGPLGIWHPMTRLLKPGETAIVTIVRVIEPTEMGSIVREAMDRMSEALSRIKPEED